MRSELKSLNKLFFDITLIRNTYYENSNLVFFVC